MIMLAAISLPFLLSLLFIASCDGFIGSGSRWSFPSNRRHRQRASLSAIREATFGMGCFWKPSEELLKVHGVLDTIVGYTGGTDATTAPSYESVCLGQSRWVEGVRVQYDDEQITYEMLLDGFFESQEPKQGSRQYASIIFPHDEEQDRVAQKWLREAHARFRSDGVYAGMTTIEPLSTFFKAEGYHQRYWQKMRPRIGAILALVALSSGTLDTVVPDSLQNSLHAVANGAGLFGCAYLMLERKLDARVVKI